MSIVWPGGAIQWVLMWSIDVKRKQKITLVWWHKNRSCIFLELYLRESDCLIYVYSPLCCSVLPRKARSCTHLFYITDRVPYMDIWYTGRVSLNWNAWDQKRFRFQIFQLSIPDLKIQDLKYPTERFLWALYQRSKSFGFWNTSYFGVFEFWIWDVRPVCHCHESKCLLIYMDSAFVCLFLVRWNSWFRQAKQQLPHALSSLKCQQLFIGDNTCGCIWTDSVLIRQALG